LCVRSKGKAAAVVVIPDEPAEQLVPGCEAASAVSQALCRAGAFVTGRQLYEHIADCHHAQTVSYDSVLTRLLWSIHVINIEMKIKKTLKNVKYVEKIKKTSVNVG